MDGEALLYLGLKFLHLLAVILWIGPPLGAYYFLFRAHASKEEARILWCEALAERVLVAEHLALLALIATGLFMVQQSAWSMLAMPWLQKKLLAFAGVLAFEAFDVWFAHRLVKRLIRERVPLSDPRWLRAERLRRWLVLTSIPVGAILLPLMIWFAISKQ